MAQKILLIQIKQLGDVLVCTPALRALKQKYPQAQIHFLTQAPAGQLLAHNPNLTQLWLYPKNSPAKAVIQLAWHLRKERFDWVIDFYNKPISALLTWATGAKLRLGYNKKGRRWAYSIPVDPTPQTPYSADERLALLAPLGVESDDLSLDFPISEPDRQTARQLLDHLGWDPDKPLITLSPVSRRAFRIWPAERFATAANLITKQTGAQLLLVWGPGEASFIKPIRLLLDQPDLGDYAPPRLAVMAAIFELATLHFGNDNGPMHIAVSARCVSLTIIGQSQMASWVPSNDPLHQGIEHDPGCKQSCRWPDCGLECLDISAETVAQKAVRLITRERG